MSQEFPSVNGVKHAYADIVIAVLGRKFRGITSINYKTKRNVGDAHGQGANRAGVAMGKVANDGSIELYREDLQNLIDAIGNGFSEVPFQITVTYRARLGARLMRDTLNGVRISEVDTTGQEGDDPIKGKATLNIGQVLLNGKSIAT